MLRLAAALLAAVALGAIVFKVAIDYTPAARPQVWVVPLPKPRPVIPNAFIHKKKSTVHKLAPPLKLHPDH
jgi:hypothetical protein